MDSEEALLKTVAILRSPFECGSKEWLDDYRIHIADKTYRDYTWDIKVLSPFFGKWRVGEIDRDHMHEYQKKRIEAGVTPIGVNHELGFISIMRKELQKPVLGYKRIKVKKHIRGRAMTNEQRLRLLRMAKENPNWFGAYLFAGLSVNTSGGPKEIFGLQLQDVHLDQKPDAEIVINGTKTEDRQRRAPLNREALEIIELAIERARSLGATQPQHYLFPRRRNALNGYDPTKPQTSIKKAWKTLRVAAGLPGLRPYDLRHHCITAMLENPHISEGTVEDICGHIDPKTKKFYSHIRHDAKKAALMRLIGDEPDETQGNEPRKKPSHGISGGRKSNAAEQLLERLLERLEKKA